MLYVLLCLTTEKKFVVLLCLSTEKKFVRPLCLTTDKKFTYLVITRGSAISLPLSLFGNKNNHVYYKSLESLK